MWLIWNEHKLATFLSVEALISEVIRSRLQNVERLGISIPCPSTFFSLPLVFSFFLRLISEVHQAVNAVSVTSLVHWSMMSMPTLCWSKRMVLVERVICCTTVFDVRTSKNVRLNCSLFLCLNDVSFWRKVHKWDSSRPVFDNIIHFMFPQSKRYATEEVYAQKN